MKALISFVVASLLVAPMAMAQVFECQTIPHEDPWTGLGADADVWHAVVDLDKGTVELNSENTIFGENPFAVLKEGSSQGFVKGTRVFRGNNLIKGFKSDKYLVAFSGKDSALERNEGAAGTRSLDTLQCRISK